VPPLCQDELVSFGRINDALLYGGEATLFVDAEDEVLAAAVAPSVSSASRAYGTPFAELYRQAGFDFHNIPKDVNSPAILHLNNLRTGRTFSAGEFNYQVLRGWYTG
jgi:methenyltetrahydromethanopterin cyclohydrolase